MANHVRAQIRALFLSKITGNTAAGSNVYKARSYPIESKKTPAIIIYSTDEEAEQATIGAPGSTIRSLTVSVEIYAKGLTDLDDEIDEIAAEVETILGAECAFLSTISAIEYSGFTTEYNGSGDNAFLVGTMEYTVNYWINNDDPTNEG